MSKHRLKEEWEKVLLNSPEGLKWWDNKLKDLQNRDIKVLQVTGDGEVYQVMKHDRNQDITYLLHVNLLLQQGEETYIEEQMIPFKIQVAGDEIVDHEVFVHKTDEAEEGKFEPDLELEADREKGFRAFIYDRRKAVQYAERWWNEYNSEYHKFEDNCTNFISQCLHAGGAQMWGEPNRSKGWWHSGTNWSYSWSVANALRWYLSAATKGLTAVEVDKATDLLPGDIICYDFEGDGKWNHNTIVVAKDFYGEPLVNAQTQNSRHRHWSYTDSPAWTRNCQYKFFRIGG